MEKLFQLKKHNTTVKTEILAGITTFLAMAYILAVNPQMLTGQGINMLTGMEAGPIFTATAISAAIGCFLMGFGANYPIALASGMGLNAYFASVCATIGGQDPWKVALSAILVEGIIFILLSLCKFRETLVNKIPANLKYGISAGIGLFIAIVGLKGADVVISDSANVIGLGNVGSVSFALCMVGLLIIGALYHYKVPGAILWGILGTWILGIIAQLIGWYKVDPANGVYSLIPDFSSGLNISAPYMFKFDLSYALHNLPNFIAIVFAFLFVDLFDTIGTVIGVAEKGNLLDKDGSLPKAGSALLADAIATVAGACLGTSTVTSYVESSAGVAQGGRTGLTAITTGIMFLIAILLSPIFTAIPSFATAPGLIFVGLLMVSSVKKMTFEGDMADSISGYLALIMMPFTSSIANGIMFGILFWVTLKILIGKVKDIHPVMWVSCGLFVLRIISLIVS